jgi:hypothetical protein
MGLRWKGFALSPSVDGAGLRKRMSFLRTVISRGARSVEAPASAAVAVPPSTSRVSGPTDAVTYFFAFGSKYWKRQGPISLTPPDSGTSTYSQLFSPSKPEGPARDFSAILGSNRRNPLSSGSSGASTDRRFPLPAMARVSVTGSPAFTWFLLRLASSS